MASFSVKMLLIGILISSGYVSAYPALQNGHVHKRQSYARSNQLAPSQDQYYGQPSYNNYNYNNNNNNNNNYYQQESGARRSHYNGNGFYQNQPQYYDYPPSSQHYYGGGGGRDPLQGSYASVNPIERELNVRNGQLRQKEYQKRTGQDARDTYDPFYFYVNPIAAAAAGGISAPPPQQQQPQPLQPSSVSPSSPEVPSPTQVTAALNAAATSSIVAREGPPRNRRNSLNAPPSRDPYFDNEISGDKYEILTSKPSYPRLQNTYPPPPHYSSSTSSRYTGGGGTTIGYNHPPPGHNNQFLNYEQIVGAQPPRYANGATPPRGSSQPWSIQIGTQLKVNDDGKGPNSGSRYYVRDERNTRSRLPPPPYRT